MTSERTVDVLAISFGIPLKLIRVAFSRATVAAILDGEFMSVGVIGSGYAEKPIMVKIFDAFWFRIEVGITAPKLQTVPFDVVKEV